MKTRQPVAVGRLITGGSGTCAKLLQQTQRLLQLTCIVRKHLPEPLDRHCTVANVHNDSLVLSTDSPAWSARLRFHAPALLRELERRHAVHLKHVHIRVEPLDAAPPRPAPSRPRLSAGTAALLRGVAAGIDDVGLREALLRLARHTGTMDDER